MCFSASVSFGASALLTTSGVLSIRKAQTSPQKLFAFTPFFFGIQQFSEGCIWLALQNPERHLVYDNLPVLTTFFLIFAWIVWPFFIPLIMLKLEPVEKRKTVLKILLFLGGIVSLFLANRLFTHEVTPVIVNHHIVFDIAKAESLQKYTGYFYFIAVIFPFGISSVRHVKILGALNLVAFLIAYVVYTHFLVSVWCFFAAIASVYILYMIYAMNGLNLQVKFKNLELPFWE
jgi:hypothetical protein